MASEYLKYVGNLFIGSLESNKCGFMRVVSNILIFCMAKNPI